MKNSTLWGRSLILAVFSLFAFTLSAQQDCSFANSLNVTAYPSCSAPNQGAQQPLVVIDLPFNALPDGPVIVEAQASYLTDFVFPAVTINTEVVNNQIAFRMTGFIVPAPAQTIQIRRITSPGNLNEEITACGVFSNTYDVFTGNATASVAKNTTRSIDPPCPDVETGRLSVNVTGFDSNFNYTPGRFTARLFPELPAAGPFVFQPNSGPNTQSNLLVESNTVLPSGTYTFVITDTQNPSCSLVETFDVGDPSTAIAARALVRDASCSGVSDGELDVFPLRADVNTNGQILITLERPDGTTTAEGAFAQSNGFYQTRVLTGLSAGQYTVNITSTTTGCMASSTVTIREPEALAVDEVSADPVCASQAGGTFEIDVTNLEGLMDSVNVNPFPRSQQFAYYVADTSATSSCWETSFQVQRISGSRNYVLQGEIPSSICLPANQDTTVSLGLVIQQRNVQRDEAAFSGTFNSDCLDTFYFTLFVRADIEQPEAVVFRDRMDGDSLLNPFCSGAEVELFVDNYDPSLTYEVYRTAALPADVTVTGVFADSAFAYTGGVVSGTFTNDNNFLQTVDYRIRATNGAGTPVCEAPLEDFSVNLRPAPFLTPLAAGSLTDTICSGNTYQSPNIRLNGATGATAVNGNVRFNYEWTLPTGLTKTGNLSGTGLPNNATTSVDEFNNTTDAQLTATLTITPIFPQTVGTLSSGVVADTCFGPSASILVSVDPVPAVEVVANDSTAAPFSTTPIPAITVCGGETVDFAITSPTANGRIFVRRTAIDGSGDPDTDSDVLVDGVAAGITRNFVAADDLSDVLTNDGNDADTLLYEFNAYTYGPDGLEAMGDDCFGPVRRLRVIVQPELIDDAVVDINFVQERRGNGLVAITDGAVVCDDTGIRMQFETSLRTGRFLLQRTFSGADVMTSVDTVLRDFNPATGTTTFELNYDNDSDAPVDVDFVLRYYTFGADGVDNEGLGDDCVSTEFETFGITVEAEPSLTLSLTTDAGTVAITEDSTILVCSGEDFLINGADIIEAATGTKVDFVDFDLFGDASFLDLDGNDAGYFRAADFVIGKDDVTNTSTSNTFQIAFLTFTPYLDNGDGVLDPQVDCAGDDITLQIVINPEPPTIDDQTITLCSGEGISVDSIIEGGNGTFLQFGTVLPAAEDFTTVSELIIPARAFGVLNFQFELFGADGGAAVASGNDGGQGSLISGTLNDGIGNFNDDVRPGDTIRVVKGARGADGLTGGAGGDATSLIVIGGPNWAFSGQQGDIVAGFVAAGGGGAGNGFNEVGADAGQSAAQDLGDTAMPGADGSSFGASGGSAFPPATGGAANSNAGGGGGGYSGGAGGSNNGGRGGEAGTDLVDLANSGTGGISRGTKTNEMSNGDVSISYIIVFNDINYTITDIDVATGLTYTGRDGLQVGDFGTDTLLTGEGYENLTDGPLDVVYTLTPSTEAGCGDVMQSFTYTATVEPRPTAFFATTATNTVTGNATDGFATTICSREGFNVDLLSNTIPSVGNSEVFFELVSVTQTPGIFIQANDADRASNAANTGMGAPMTPFGGNTADAAVDFFETAIFNNTGADATVTYRVATFIENSPADCVGDTIELTVTIQPGFPINGSNAIVEAVTDVCETFSFAESGFSFDDDVYAAGIPAIDMIRVESYTIEDNNGDAPAAAQVDTINGPDLSNGSILVTPTEFENYRFGNTTGGQLNVDFVVRLVTTDGCESAPFDLFFDLRAAPIIDTVETLTNIINDTICSRGTAGIEINPASNSAFGGVNFTNGSNAVVFTYSVDLNGLELIGGAPVGGYPVTSNDNDEIADDQFRNPTTSALTAIYTVIAEATTYGCRDTATYTVTVEPEPLVTFDLVSGDSTATFDADNAAAFLPNPEFAFCSDQPLTTSFSDVPTTSDDRELMTDVTITDVEGITDFDVDNNGVATFTVPVSDLADTLSFVSGELTNETDMPITFTVRVQTRFANANCGAQTIIEYDVIVNPVNTTFAVVRSDQTAGNLDIDGTTICSGSEFDLVVRTDPNQVNALADVDSFRVEVIAPGLVAAPGETGDGGTFFVVGGTQTAFFNRVENLSFTNPTMGEKTATFIVTALSEGCDSRPDTTTISFFSEINLSLEEASTVCTAGPVSFTATDLNQTEAFNDANVAANYDWRYIGGTAFNYSISAVNGASNRDITPSNNNGQAGFNFANRKELRINPNAGTQPGTAIFRIEYADQNGCSTIDTLTMTIATVVTAGTVDAFIPTVCETANLSVFVGDFLTNQTGGGVFFNVNGSTAGLNAMTGEFTPGALNSTDGAVETFTFRYAVGQAGSGCVADTSADIVVNIQPILSAGTYVGTPIEACQSLDAVNLFDGLTGETTGGTFTQVNNGAPAIAVGSDGEFDQSGAAVGTYVYTYELPITNGCPGDEETVVVEVVSTANCSSTVKCDTIQLFEGFNTIAFDALPPNATSASIFADQISNNELVSIFTIDPSSGASETYFTLGTSVFDNVTYRDGTGYIVEVSAASQVIVCGVAADTMLRVALNAGASGAGLNVVGYTARERRTAEAYFGELLDGDDLNSITTVSVLNGAELQATFPAIFNDAIFMNNSQGYLIDVSMSYGENTWNRNGGVLTTSLFGHYFGVTDLDATYAGEAIRFTTADGQLLGKTTLNADGTYAPITVFGDLDVTPGLVEGLRANEEIYATFRDQTVATGAFFSGNWKVNALDLTFDYEANDDTAPEAAAAFSLNVFPNPTDGLAQLAFDLERDYANLTVEVFNTLGQLVAEQRRTQVSQGTLNLEIDLTNLPVGSYQLRVVTDNELRAYRQLIRK